MAVLCNRLNKQDALKKIAQEDFSRKTVSFYRYVRIADPMSLRDELWEEWNELGALGRIYVSQEGINAQMNVPEPNWERFVELLHARPTFAGIPFKIALEEPQESFWKLTIKVKDQIVADGLKPEEYDVENVGKHLSASEFNQALEQGSIVVDMRNHYESRIGHFEGAYCPDVDTFREQLPMVKEALKGKENEKVLLYCTGGIRCEKASAYLKHYGFKDVNQLHGGIIDYTHQIKREELPSRFIGKNFVFDDRMAETVTDDVLSTCDQCEQACDSYTNCKNVMCNLLFLQCESCKEQYENCCSDQCKEVIHLPLEEQKQLRKGVPHTFSRYKKQIRPEVA